VLNREAKIRGLWMGPDQKPVTEGFDDLFQVKEDYQIPAPSAESKEKLQKISASIMDEDEFKDAFNSVFGATKEGLRGAMETMFSKKDTTKEITNTAPLRAVQAATAAVNIMVVEPRSFEDSLEIVNHLKSRKSVIVNLQYLDHEVSQRVIDFVSGATLALDGTQERVGHGVFIFASMNCRVETESEGSKAYKDLFSRTFS
jgi:FtsZ-interacting cell division protein YlmF